MKKLIKTLLIAITVIFIAGCNSQLDFHKEHSLEIEGNFQEENVHTNHNIQVENDPHAGHMNMNHEVNSEFEFILEMIPHHQEAITSSIQLLEQTQNQELINLANEIILVQNEEIALMNQWLDSWYPNEIRESNYMEMMPDLNNFQGLLRDNVYLVSMIEHHEMAIIMAESVLKIPGIREEVRTLANEIISLQKTEIELMQDLIQ